MFSPSPAPRLAGRLGAISAAALALTIATSGPGVTEAQPAAAPGTSDEIQRFCGNVADAARDRRYMIQTLELEALKAEIATRVAQLETKRAEYEKWMTLRQKFMDHASESVVKIYARMKPDAAAERLAAMKAELAAAILLKLETKQSGLIMNEMERTMAAKLTGIMASAANGDNPT